MKKLGPLQTKNAWTGAGLNPDCGLRFKFAADIMPNSAIRLGCLYDDQEYSVVLTRQERDDLHELCAPHGRTVVSPPMDAVQVLMHDRDAWKARALKAEAEITRAVRDASQQYAQGRRDEHDRASEMREVFQSLKRVLESLDD